MKSSSNLKSLLKNIDRKGYPAYKNTQGTYDFGTYFLSIDHVQGDPSIFVSTRLFSCFSFVKLSPTSTSH